MKDINLSIGFIICFLILIFITNVKSIKSSSVVVIGHRGASGYLPEHTLSAKALAYGQGVDYIEQDVVLSKDNVPIVIHDIYLDEISNVASQYPTRNRSDGRFYAIDFTVAEIKTLRASERFSHQTGKPIYPKRFPLNQSTFHLVTLVEELEFITGLNKANIDNNKQVGVYVEIKEPSYHRNENRSNFSEIVLDILRKYNYTKRTDKIFLQCFDLEELQRIRLQLQSDLKLVGLLPDNKHRNIYSKTDYTYWRSDVGIEDMSTFVDGIGPHYSLLYEQGNTLEPSKLYNDVRKNNLFIHPYTFRNDADLKPFATFDVMLEFFIDKLKVDGLFTDHPDKTRKRGVSRMLVITILFLYVLGRVQGVARPLVIGHRGTAYLPELTLASQSMAYAYGADIIEIDVCLSRDNQLIVIHDIYLDGVSNVAEIFPNRNHSNGFHYVIDFDLAELRRLSIRERFIPFNGTQVFPLRFPSNTNISFHLSTLNETIELLLGLNHATRQRRQLLIEIKKPEYHSKYNKSISSIVLATLNAYNLIQPTDPVILQTFHIEELMHIRRNLGSKLRLFALMTWNRINESSSDYDFYRSEEGIRNLSNIVQALAPNHEFVVNYDSNGTILGVTNLTKWAHQYGLAVYPYTFRQDLFPGKSFEQLIAYFWDTVKVDGFITDHPNVILEYLQREMTLTNFTTINPNSSSSRFVLSIMILIFNIIVMSKKFTGPY
ncbi:unnamed protein product [Rotaria sordida]|uniref:glycerophosphodiester phosphodiesterase n=1 Tax=Rotaria sordida TaxID=392033 RepID=A0A813RU45_9BILA|nr:unnamed protein product [Rotaria sordida]